MLLFWSLNLLFSLLVEWYTCWISSTFQYLKSIFMSIGELDFSSLRLAFCNIGILSFVFLCFFEKVACISCIRKILTRYFPPTEFNNKSTFWWIVYDTPQDKVLSVSLRNSLQYCTTVLQACID